MLQDVERSRQLQQASELARKCLPLLLQGIGNRGNMERFAGTILEETDWAGVIIADRNEIIACRQKKAEKEFWPEGQIPGIGIRAMESGNLMTMSQVDEGLFSGCGALHDTGSGCGMPDRVGEETVGVHAE